MTWHEESELFKSKAFRSNTKVPNWMGELRVRYNDLEIPFQVVSDDGEVLPSVKIETPCVVDYANNVVFNEQGRKYKW